MSTIFATVIGNLGGAPEVRTIANGQQVTDVSIAVNSKDQQGNKSTLWVKVSIWGKRGAAFAQHHQKGDLACCSGELKQETWTDQQTGQPRSKLALNASGWEFVKQSQGGQQGQQQGWQQQGAPPQQQGYQPPYQPPQGYQQQPPPQQQYQQPPPQHQQQYAGAPPAMPPGAQPQAAPPQQGGYAQPQQQAAPVPQGQGTVRF